jgi:hypothetical protein
MGVVASPAVEGADAVNLTAKPAIVRFEKEIRTGCICSNMVKLCLNAALDEQF